MKNPIPLGAASVLLLGHLALAQDRAPAFGLVLDADRKPVAGAEVHLLGGVPMLSESEQELDELRVQTDARGRFKAALVSGRCYSVRALCAIEQDGERSVSLAAEQFSCGGHVELVMDRRTKSRTVQVAGAKPWLGQGPLRLRVGLDSRWTRWQELPVGADGTAEVRSLPPGLHAFVLLDGAGQPLCVEQVPSSAPARIEIPAPLVAAVHCRDAKGAPLAGVEIYAHVAMFQPCRSDPLGAPMEVLWRRCAITDVAGEAHAVVPNARFLHSEVGTATQGWTAVRPSLAAAAASAAIAQEGPGERSVQLDFVVPEPEPTAVRFSGPEGKPLGNVRVVARSHGAAGLWCGAAGMLRTDGAGRLVLPAATATDRAFQLLLAVPDASALLSLLGARITAAGSLALRETGLVEVQVLAIDGGPAAGCLLAQPLVRDRMLATEAVLDPAGRVRLRLWPGSWLLFACNGGSAGWVMVHVVAGGQGRQEIRLAPMYQVTGRVWSAAGEPVARASITASMIRKDVPETPEVALLEQTLREFNSRRTVATDAGGHFVLRLAQQPSGRGGSVSAWLDGGRVASAAFGWDGAALELRAK